VDERVNRVALDALRDPEGNVHDHLLDALTEGEKKYRRGVADALDMLGWEPATPEHHAYYLMAKDRWAELEGVGAAAIGPLEEALRDPDPGIRLEALKAVGRIGGERAIRPLIHALSDPDAMLRSRAERALIDTGAPAAAPLEAAMEGADDRTRTLIGRILGRIAPENSEERQD
jgi:HEAT repeat protein